MNCAETQRQFKENLLTTNPPSSIIIEEDNQTFDKVNLSLSTAKLDSQKTSGNNGVFYFIIPSKINIENVTYDTYGIGAIENNIIVDYILDLSIEFERVKSFVNMCNDNELSLIHLKDVVEDFLLD